MDNNILEDDQVFSASLTSGNAGVGSSSSIDVSITDNDGNCVYKTIGMSFINMHPNMACVPLNVGSQYVYT